MVSRTKYQINSWNWLANNCSTCIKKLASKYYSHIIFITWKKHTKVRLLTVSITNIVIDFWTGSQSAKNTNVIFPNFGKRPKYVPSF